MVDNLSFWIIPDGFQMYKNNPILEKSDKFENYLENLIINSNDIPIDEQIKNVCENFFELIFKINTMNSKIFLNLISKLFNKLKNLYYLNLLIFYYRIFDNVIYEINSNYNEDIKFNFKDDIILTPIFISKTIKIKFTSTTKEKLNYLLSLVEKIIYSKFDYDYVQFNIFYSSFPYGHVLEIIFLDDRLFLKNSEEKINLTGFSNAILRNENHFSGDKLKEIFLKCEFYIMHNFKLTNKNKVNFINSFNELKKLLFSNSEFKEKIYDMFQFGSFTQLSYNIISDLEITIITKDYENYNPQNSESIMIRIKEFLKKESNKYENINIRNTKRIILMDLYDKDNNVKIELVINNIFGIINSYLIYNYLTFDSRAIILVNTIKNWSKEKGINGNYKGHLSSYCYTLMVIYFLQRIKEPILPIVNSKNNLHKIIIQNKEYFLEKSLLCNFNNISFKTKNKDSISILMMKFLMFYLYEFNENRYCIDITNEKVVFRYEEMSYLNYLETKNKRSAYVFIDMFDYSYNPGAYLDQNSTPHKNLKDVMRRTLFQMLNTNKNMLKNDGKNID